MTPLGRSLAFYLTYFEEMNAIYEDGKQIEGVDTQVAKRIGAQAGLEVRQLIDACISGCLERLRESGEVRIVRQNHSTVERNWDLQITLWRRGQRRRGSAQRQIGIQLNSDGELHPWLWSRGGLAAESQIRQLLSHRGERCLGSRDFFGWHSGAIALESVRLPIGNARDRQFEVDAAPAIAQVQRALEPITPAFMRRFLADH